MCHISLTISFDCRVCWYESTYYLLKNILTVWSYGQGTKRQYLLINKISLLTNTLSRFNSLLVCLCSEFLNASYSETYIDGVNIFFGGIKISLLNMWIFLETFHKIPIRNEFPRVLYPNLFISDNITVEEIEAL